jgi:hypothetical protein
MHLDTFNYGATAVSLTTIDRLTLSILDLMRTERDGYSYAECHQSQCHYWKCNYFMCRYTQGLFAECCYAQYHYTVCLYTEHHYTERLYTEYHYQECNYSIMLGVICAVGLYTEWHDF